ncbi:MAG: hypothetical protein LBJ24_04435 [Treponema sp.]|jgi:hypothetical protein|nr:hypothetical protein [Treponema sp.]
MTFSERMKFLLDQSFQASRELAAKAGEKAQGLGEKSVELMNKAADKAQDLGERGVLMLEIKQLEGQAQKLVARLGSEVYRIFVEQGERSLSADAPAVKAVLDEIALIRESIEKREAELAARKGRN